MPYIVKSSLEKEKTIMDNSKMQELIEDKERYIKELEKENDLKTKEIEELKKTQSKNKNGK